MHTIADLINAKLNFEIRDFIGKGGMAQVHQAYDLQMDAILAIKSIPKVSFPRASEYFLESQKLYKSRHHNVVPIYYGCQDDNHIYLAMPYYKNRSLQIKMAGGFLTTREIIRYALQFLSGLNNIHVKKLIHFDVKCSNLLLDDHDNAQLCDFGLAQYMSHYGFAESMGTSPALAPPDFFKQDQHNLKFDIYQAGLALYQMCSGYRIFAEQHLAQSTDDENRRDDELFKENVINGNFPNRNFWWHHIPKPLRNVIKTALSIDPDKRYDSLIPMMNDLSAIDGTDWVFKTDYARDFNWERPGFKVNATFESNSTWTVSSTKGIRRNHSYCGVGLNESEKDKLLYSCLNDKNW
jgi:serine/threonine protein kinase